MSDQNTELLTVQGVAERLHVSKKRVYTLIQEGRLEALRISARGLRISEKALTKYTDRCLEYPRRQGSDALR